MAGIPRLPVGLQEVEIDAFEAARGIARACAQAHHANRLVERNQGVFLCLTCLYQRAGHFAPAKVLETQLGMPLCPDETAPITAATPPRA